MSKKVNVCLVLCLFVLLSTGSIVIAEETSRTFPNVGVIKFPSDVEVLPLQLDIKDDSGYTLLTQDNKTWRSINIYLVTNISDKNELNQIANYLGFVSTAGNAKIGKNGYSKLLANSQVNKSAVNSEHLIINSNKSFDNGVIICTNFYSLDGTAGPVLMITATPDGDRSYWEPIIAKMIADIKK